MLLIVYVMKKTTVHGYSTIVELCGEFRDLEHFDNFKKNEAWRGWKLKSYRILSSRPIIASS
jgi:hypothetical protein